MSKQGQMNYKKLAWVVGIPAWYLLWVALIAWVPGFHKALNESMDAPSPTWAHLTMSVWGAFGAILGGFIIHLCAIGLKKATKAFWSWLHN